MSHVTDDYTVVELLELVAARIRAQRLIAASDSGREFALAITHLEDAQMRYTRGRAMETNQFHPGDLDAATPEGK